MTTGGTKVELSEGKVWTLRYETPEIVRMEEASGRSLQELQLRAGRVHFTSLVWLIWGGLIHAEPELKFDQVAKRFRSVQLKAVSESITEALKKGVYGEDEEEEDADGEEVDPEGNGETPA